MLEEGVVVVEIQQALSKTVKPDMDIACEWRFCAQESCQAILDCKDLHCCSWEQWSRNIASRSFDDHWLRAFTRWLIMQYDRCCEGVFRGHWPGRHPRVVSYIATFHGHWPERPHLRVFGFSATFHGQWPEKHTSESLAIALLWMVTDQKNHTSESSAVALLFTVSDPENTPWGSTAYLYRYRSYFLVTDHWNPFSELPMIINFQEKQSTISCLSTGKSVVILVSGTKKCRQRYTVDSQSARTVFFVSVIEKKPPFERGAE